MTRQEFMEYHAACLEKMAAICRAKNADYSHSDTVDDPFLNFTRVESFGVCKTEVGFMTRMLDKLSRINSFVQRGDLKVADESVEDTLFDLANYSILMAGYLKAKKEKLAVTS